MWMVSNDYLLLIFLLLSAPVLLPLYMSLRIMLQSNKVSLTSFLLNFHFQMKWKSMVWQFFHRLEEITVDKNLTLFLFKPQIALIHLCCGFALIQRLVGCGMFHLNSLTTCGNINCGMREMSLLRVRYELRINILIWKQIFCFNFPNMHVFFWEEVTVIIFERLWNTN